MLHKACVKLFLAGMLCCPGLSSLSGCAGQESDSAALEKTQTAAAADYDQELDESLLERQQPFTRTELTRIINDGGLAAAETKDSEDPEAAFNFLVEQRNWDEDRLNYILIKISYIVAQLEGKTFRPEEARFYAALKPTPQEAGMVKARLEPLTKLLPHFPR